MSKFQIIIIGIFVICIIAGVAAFALYRGGASNNALPQVTIWGTFPAKNFNDYVSNLNLSLSQSLNINYVQKNPDSFNQEFTNALALGHGPDAVLVSTDMILPLNNKLTPIPYSVFPERTFMDSFIGETQIYISGNGVIAMPFIVDPLVMYWNRDMFASAGIATYPRYWDEFAGLNQKLTQKSGNGTITQSAAAMGDFTNITNAREVLGALLLQLGNPVTTLNDQGISSTLDISPQTKSVPAVDFWSRFADPTNANYSWNRAMPDDKTAFLSGILATYFGFASEIKDLRSKNPNLNFDVAPLPQARKGGVSATYGKMYGFSLVRASQNTNAAYQVISILTAPQSLANLSASLYLPSVLLSADQNAQDPYIDSFDKAALISKSWFDIGASASRQILGNMIGSITSGSKTSSEAVSDAADRYNAALKSIQ